MNKMRDKYLTRLAESGYKVTGDEFIVPSPDDIEIIIKQALDNGEDPHHATALVMYGGQEITEQQRYVGKSHNFPVLYGYRGR